MTARQRIIVGISGASGAVIGVRLLQALARIDAVESHLVVSSSGALTAAQELGIRRSEIESLADVAHSVRDIGAAVASGSFVTRGMVIAPCSMKTLASIANGFADNLLTRAADVVLKERRRLVTRIRRAERAARHASRRGQRAQFDKTGARRPGAAVVRPGRDAVSRIRACAA